MPQRITEAAAPPEPTGAGRLNIRLITPGWGSSGFYSRQVLENAAADRVWPAGTQMYLDHPSESEMYDRPERSVRDLAAVLTEDARWDGQGLVAEAQIIGPYKTLLTDETFVESTGVSIRAAAETTTGEAEGRKGTIITRLTEGVSVDFVTKAGRGGQILAVLESARADAGEALTREIRDLLQLAVGDDSWVVDFDPDASQVIYRREWEENGTYRSELVRDKYSVAGGAATLAGKPKPVRQTVKYTPVSQQSSESGPTNVPAPAGQPEDHSPTEGNTMGTIQIDESRHSELVEAAGRVPTLEAERDAAVQRADAAEAERDQLREASAERDRVDKARKVIDARAREAGVEFSPLETRGLLALSELPVTEAGDFDEAAFTATVDEVAAAKAQEAGAGAVRGFGAATHQSGLTESDVDKAVAGVFGRTIKEA